MKVLDTDTLSFFLRNHPRVTARRRQCDEEVVIPIIARIETLQGRFASLLKAANGDELQVGQTRIDQAERDLAPFRVLPVRSAVSIEFDRLRDNRSLRKIGRADLLIACIALAHKASLVTRNLKHFRLVPGLKLENWMD
jgi:tRNA(fMet)-specific endonuclease VapC